MSVLAPWLDDSVPALQQTIVRRAICDIGIVEIPPGSNRSPRIDEYVAAVGSPPGSRWCAAAVAAWWRDSGADVPPLNAGSCNAWVTWSRRLQSWESRPAAGSAVIYGSNDIASHIGVIVRVAPLLLSVEGNTSIAGNFDPDGVAVALKQVATSRVLGYIKPGGAHQTAVK